jgi:predicted RNase H-like HicB family nuclease
VHTASNSGSAGNGPVPSQSTTVGEQIFSGLRDTLHFVVYRGEKVYVAEGVDLAAVTQGSTLDEVLENVKEVVALYLEGEDAASLGLVAHPRIQLLCEIPPVA